MAIGHAVVHIYYGSQTGTAEAFAYELRDEAVAQGVPARVCDLDSFKPSEFCSHHTIIMVVATTGEGDPTDNAIKFRNWALDRHTPANSLANLRFAVFGLGDRTYLNFNLMGEITDACMERLGAHRICARGIGDNSNDIVEDFQKWKLSFWPALKAVHDFDERGSCPELPQEPQDPILHMAASIDGLPADVEWQPADVLARFAFEAERARVIHVSEQRQVADISEGLSTVHVELDVSGSSLLASHSVADTAEILPENDPSEVKKMLSLLGISEACKPGDIGDLDCCIAFAHTSTTTADLLKKPFPTPCSLRDALTRYCDLQSAPSRRMLTAMLPHLPDDARKRVTCLLADSAAMKVVQDVWLGWTQFEFWSAMSVDHLHLGTFLLHCPRQRARPYTIASSPLSNLGQIHICASLVSHPSVSLEDAVDFLRARGVLSASCQVPERSSRWYGLCSHWLCTRLHKGHTILVRTRTSAFHPPPDDVPIIMVAAGAGVAPFRAFWQHFQRVPRNSPSVLLYGCRHSDRDWLYRAEMSSMCRQSADHSQQMPLSDLSVAFSRMGEEGVYDPSGCCGEYVQDLLQQKSKHVQHWIEDGAILYICGSNRLGQSVLECLGLILAGCESDVHKLRLEGRIVMELWGEPPMSKTFTVKEGTMEGANEKTQAKEDTDTLCQALLEAVKNGSHGEVQHLLMAKADANFQAGSRKYTRIGLRQEVGETALHWAALRGDDVAAQWLLEAHADPDLQDQDGKAPLHIAAFNGVASVSKQLLETLCNPNARDLRGNTPLQWVVLAGGSVRMTKLLLKYGACGDIANDDGEFPADVAEEQGSDAVASLIRNAAL